MLEIWLELCGRAGIDEVFINLHAHSDVVRATIGQHQNGVKVVFCEEQDLLGSAGTLLANRDWVAGEPEFWVFYADVLTNLDLTRMLVFHRARRPVATIGVYKVADPERCGITLVDEHFVVREFTEKPANPRSDLAFSGVLIATPELLGAIPTDIPADLGFHVLPRLVGRMLAYPISEYLLDIGTMENYTAAQSTWPGLSASDRRVC
jgi:mannose-1-phosphate guanylyltransferase